MTEDIGIVSSLADTIYNKSFVKKSVSLTANGYSTICKYVKPICPGLISKPWSQIETYISENQSVVLNNSDYYVGNAVNFLSGVKKAHQNNETTDYILTAVEDLIKEDSIDGYETADDDANSTASENTVEITPQCASIRVKMITTTVSQSLLKKASTMTQIDFMKYSAFIANAPFNISKTLISYTTDSKKMLSSTIVKPVTNAYTMYKEGEKSTVEILLFLKNSAETSFCDTVVAPVAAYLDVPNLHFTTLKPMILECGMKKYESATNFGTTQYVTAKDVVSIQYMKTKKLGDEMAAAANNGVTYLLNMCTDRPLSELEYVEIPAAVFNKLAGAMSCLYTQYFGKDSTPIIDTIKSASAKASEKFEFVCDKIYTSVVVPIISKKKMD
jgi:hypothetical protein